MSDDVIMGHLICWTYAPYLAHFTIVTPFLESPSHELSYVLGPIHKSGPDPPEDRSHADFTMVPPVKTAGAAATALSVIAVLYYILIHSRRARLCRNYRKHRSGILAAIGNTALIRINSQSLTPPDVKFSEKQISRIESGELSPGGVVTEGSAGSTAISLATAAPAYGCKCHVVVPDDAAEKSQILEALGATVERVRPVSITHTEHYVNIARGRALEAKGLASEHQSSRQTSKQIKQVENGVLVQGKHSLTSLVDSKGGGFFADQFENLANFRAHYEGTGPERFGNRLVGI
ncbi:cysteine synthase 2-like [Primulina eburnea]|uniref:cysteine synthase 2-like n=1 Tax=Primulina eburnea TaxID=1245227 RepID=UPI003C6C13CA